eukprot:TRINITY_DN8695_c0_g2_i1.p1 TRINITY_DN8695_c0_g2~~TRINITY_DN8695_c0_g2_i1.p1  ORF type:complete len:526 (-),score=117.47 TRINITY_DN8695_c0_g2_i1:19-1569(-)
MSFAMCNNFHEAYSRLTQSLTILIHKLGKDHVEVADCQAFLGDVCMKLYVEAGIQDKLEEARKFYLEANRIIKAALGEEHTKCKQFQSLLFICENFIAEKKEDNRPLDELVMVLYDVSASMTTRARFSTIQIMDRGEVSKAFFGAFIDKVIAFNYSIAIGLITFGEFVTVKLPLTRKFEQFCKEIGKIATTEDYTSCWDAIDKAITDILDFKQKNLKLLSPNCTFRILCLTDGEDNRSKNTPDKVLSRLRNNHIILDSIPIEGKHDLLRGLTNASGGLCFLVDNYEVGLSIFEREGLLSLKEREIHEVTDQHKPVSQLVNLFPYTKSPAIKIPKLNAVSVPISNTISINLPTDRLQRIMKEAKNIANSNELPQFDFYITESDISLWKVIYHGEEGTPYASKHWPLFVSFPENYPQVPPTIRFLASIYHCNINNDGKICHEILNDQSWSDSVTVLEIFTKLAILIKHPNPLNSIDSVKGSLFQDNRQLYYETAMKSSQTNQSNGAYSNFFEEKCPIM